MHALPKRDVSGRRASTRAGRGILPNRETVVLSTPPRNIRELFDALGDCPETSSLGSFIGQFDWSEALVQNVYYTFLNRLPESESVVRGYALVDRAQHALETIAGGEFQGRIVELVLKAYPEKQRLIHIHIPKTAGVDFREKLVDHLPYVHLNHGSPEATPPESLLAHLAEMSRRAKVEDQILATGHIPLAWYVDKDLCRPDDRLFAIVREPRESLLSLINYYLRRIQEDPDCEFPDTQSYANFLGVDRFARELDIHAQREIGKAMLMNEFDALSKPPQGYAGTRGLRHGDRIDDPHQYRNRADRGLPDLAT